jgi:hypothetical protein
LVPKITVWALAVAALWVFIRLDDGRRSREAWVENLNSKLEETQLSAVGWRSEILHFPSNQFSQCAALESAIMRRSDMADVRDALRQHGFVALECGARKESLGVERKIGDENANPRYPLLPSCEGLSFCVLSAFYFPEKPREIQSTEANKNWNNTYTITGGMSANRSAAVIGFAV